MIKIISAQLFLIFSLATLSFAQTTQEKPVLIDEFSIESDETVMARADSVIFSSGIHSLSNNSNPKTRLKVIISGNTNEHYSTFYRYASRLSGYFIKNRGISSEKFSFDFCKTDEEFKIQFFSYSANQEFPKCRRELKSPEKTTLFDNIGSDFPKLSLIPADTYFYDIGPSEGEYSKFALDALSEILKKQPSSKVIVIGYLNANGKRNGNDKWTLKTGNFDKKSELKEIFVRTKILLTQTGIKAHQIQFIDGGYMNNSKRLEFWFQPEGGAIPNPKPDYFPKRKRTK